MEREGEGFWEQACLVSGWKGDASPPGIILGLPAFSAPRASTW